MTTIFKQISAGYSRSLALLDDNSAWAWGNIGRTESPAASDAPWAAICGSGPQEIGHNRFAQPLPQLLNPNAPYGFLADAINELMALDMHGQVGMLATATSLSSGAACSPVTGIPNGMKQICANETASYALDASGKVWSWGSNFQGQLGRQSDGALNQPPAKIETLPIIASLATGKNHTLALSNKGEVWAWGANTAGQLGQGNLSALTRPARVLINTPIKAIAAGDTHSLAIDVNGRLYVWGSNNLGQLGPVMSSKLPGFSARPVRVQLSFKLKQVDAGMHYTIALSEQGEVYAWGWNGMGQLGKLSLTTPDAGIALAGLPSTETSQGRFVKAAFYANYVRKASNPDDAITTLAHIMNNFDRPYDLTVDGAGGIGDGPRSNTTSSEVTYYTVLNDLSRNLFYIRTIDSMNWSMLDLNKLKSANKVKTTITFNVGKPGADEFSRYYQ